jgi:hypothetical protein
VAAWELGTFWLGAGQSSTYWVSWGDTWQGLQFIAALPRGAGEARMDIVGHGVRAIPRFGTPPLISYWVDVVNRGPSDTTFVLSGHRVD